MIIDIIIHVGGVITIKNSEIVRYKGDQNYGKR